ncbi:MULTISPECIES: A24 family peptidase [unclassified Iodidimonas]|uniref:prepilin peptidase n=1 Tax=unclassified Iodidimonas TaxID=2626145 RepID=UPI00248265D3|nr:MULTISPECIES: A24 family peptidase [unclassified Iodidimonas]
MIEPFWGLSGLFIAPFLGSFFALLADRLPRDEPVALVRSACRTCGTPLAAYDLVPILSFLILRGRCRTCGTPIPRHTLIFELLALLIAAQSVLAMGWGISSLATLFLGLILLTLAVIDARHFFLPDLLTLPLILMGLFVAGFIGPVDLLSAALGAMAGYGLLAGIAYAYRHLRGREGLGLGDAKLLAAAGAWMGWQALPYVLLLASLSGLFYVLGQRLRGHHLGAGDAIPFGPFIALSFWLLWLYGQSFFGRF